LPEWLEVAAYYVVSESLTNAAKHSHATVVYVEFEADDALARASPHSSVVEDVEVAAGVTVVLPLLVEDHMQTLLNGMFAGWMTGRVGRGTDPLELHGGDGADRLSDLVHTLASYIENIFERGTRLGVDPPTGGIG
jgi:hypothetical protein